LFLVAALLILVLASLNAAQPVYELAAGEGRVFEVRVPESYELRVVFNLANFSGLTRLSSYG